MYKLNYYFINKFLKISILILFIQTINKLTDIECYAKFNNKLQECHHNLIKKMIITGWYNLNVDPYNL